MIVTKPLIILYHSCDKAIDHYDCNDNHDYDDDMMIMMTVMENMTIRPHPQSLLSLGLRRKKGRGYPSWKLQSWS